MLGFISSDNGYNCHYPYYCCSGRIVEVNVVSVVGIIPSRKPIIIG